jgi:hypothetical protein
MVEEKEDEVSAIFLSHYFHTPCTKKRSISGDWKYVIIGTSNSSLYGIVKLDKLGASEAPSNSYLGRPVCLHAFHTNIETKLPSV